MFEIETKYYNDNKSAFLERYNGRYVVIKGNKLLGSYDDQMTAITETMKTEELGTFMVKLCTREESVQQYHSRVVFSN